MPKAYVQDGDFEFIGLNSRDNPQTLKPGYVSKSQNFRFNQGVANTRRGLKRLTPTSLAGIELVHATTFRNASGVDLIVLVATNAIYTYNTDTNDTSSPIAFPSGQTITPGDPVDAIQAGGYLYILRGFSKTVLRWNGATTISNATGFPNSVTGVYNANRSIVQTTTDSISVSHYLEMTSFSLLDVFKINDGSNDSITAIAPWVLNEFVVFMRNKIYYASVGSGAVLSGNAANVNDSYVKVAATDIGCNARKSIVQAAGGMIFMSDFGIYMMTPQSATTPEGMRMGIMGKPLSANIEDVMLDINQDAVANACAVYFENRYFIAVPLGDSEYNNAVLVYNFINKEWESVDTFQNGMDISFIVTGIYQGRRRMFYIDKDEGIFLADELEFNDEFDGTTNNNVLPFYIPFNLNELGFTKYPIDSQLVTRSYLFKTLQKKRYSSVEVDLYAPELSKVKTYSISSNPDVEVLVDDYMSFSDNDVTRRVPVRSVSTSCKIKLATEQGSPLIKSIIVNALPIGQNTSSSD